MAETNSKEVQSKMSSTEIIDQAVKNLTDELNNFSTEAFQWGKNVDGCESLIQANGAKRALHQSVEEVKNNIPGNLSTGDHYRLAVNAYVGRYNGTTWNPQISHATRDKLVAELEHRKENILGTVETQKNPERKSQEDRQNASTTFSQLAEELKKAFTDKDGKKAGLLIRELYKNFGQFGKESSDNLVQSTIVGHIRIRDSYVNEAKTLSVLANNVSDANKGKTDKARTENLLRSTNKYIQDLQTVFGQASVYDNSFLSKYELVRSILSGSLQKMREIVEEEFGKNN